MTTDTFPIIPANPRFLWIIVIVLAVVLSAVVWLVYASIHGAKHSRFEVSADGLRICGDTDKTRVVYVPTTAGYSLLLSVSEPERFLSRLREIAPE